MSNRYYMVFIGVVIAIGCIFESPLVLADSAISTITATLTPGDLTMTVPSDASFKATLTGRKQSVKLETLQTDVTDYRGSTQGWQLAVNSPNFNDYGENYEITINGQAITNSEHVVYSNQQNDQLSHLQLPMVANISENAKAGTYSATLEWHLQPSIDKTIKE